MRSGRLRRIPARAATLAAAATFTVCAAAGLGTARAQSVYEGKLRYSAVILQAADAARVSAERSEQAQDYLSGVRQMEQFLAENGDAPPSLVTYPVLVTIAAAHLEAAYDRIKLPERLSDYKNNLALHEQNQALINDHLNAIPDLLVTAQKLLASSELSANAKAQFRCEALRQLAAGVGLHGVVNNQERDIDSALHGYSLLRSCGFDDEGTVRQLKFLKANMGHSLFSPDNIVEAASKLVETVVPHGDLISLGLQAAYGYIKAREAELPPPR